MLEKYFSRIAEELSVRTDQVKNTVSLLNDGATVPFIARYRKEVTESLDEFQITRIRDRMGQMLALDKRKEVILKSIEEQDLLTDELRDKIAKVDNMSELEDIYLPYKPKRKTRGTIAKAKGLEPLAKMIMLQNNDDVESMALKFVNPEKEVQDVDKALAGARDIIAEWINEHQYARKRVREKYQRFSLITATVTKGKEQDGIKYKNYFEWEENLSKSPSHRVLAMLRGEREGFLSLKVSPNKDDVLDILDNIFLKEENKSTKQVGKAIDDSYKRLIHPSMETEMKTIARERADEKAVEVFVENLRQLLLAAPLGEKNVLAIDPGFRTGCKVVCLDRQGKLLHNETIYPHPPESDVKQAVKKITSLVDAYKIEAIAIGNGTAGRETERFIKSMRFSKDIIAVMVNESGASIYSASKVARDEFPDYDITVRGAVSIGRRLMDPLAELVKIDPKSIGVGQYQHDVDQKLLAKSLEDTVESCVNAVGVEVNTASKDLLSFVSGVGPVLADNIIKFRDENGAFNSREDFKKVKRFGPKVFEQAAGFLRIQNATNMLDKSAVHPESYGIVSLMAKKVGAGIDDLVRDESLRRKISLKEFVSEKVGMPTLKDIMEELDKPGRDPRKKFDVFEFAQGINDISDLKEGMIVPGIVTNITDFGAFVDVGVHQDGLIHISELADRFIKDPKEIVSLNQKVNVKVISVDIGRRRIQLSLKQA